MDIQKQFAAFNQSLAGFRQFDEATKAASEAVRVLGLADNQAAQISKILEASAPSQSYLQQLENTFKASATKALSQEEAFRKALGMSGLQGSLSRSVLSEIDRISMESVRRISGISDYVGSTHSLTSALDSIVNPWWDKNAAQLADLMGERERLMQRFAFNSAGLSAPKFSVMAQGIVETAENEVTLDGALKMILEAIRDAKEPEMQKWLWFILVPFVFMLLQAFLNPLADVYVKKWQGESEQESRKQVIARAAGAVGDKSWLSEHRFVARKSLKVTSSASAGSPEVGKLEYGQAVRVIEKRGDFTLVVWTSSDGEGAIRGWVFSRYLRRFS